MTDPDPDPGPDSGPPSGHVPQPNPAPTASLQALPLFPLGTVLFPGGVLPLRIFEVRYLDMIGKCHKVGAPFGVVSLTAGSEVQKPAPGATEAGAAFAQESFHAVGTLATITEFATPQSGLMVVNCLGSQRFRVVRQERLPYGLWIADVVRIADDAPLAVPPDLQRIADALATLISRLEARLAAEVGQGGDGPGGRLPFQRPYQLGDCAWVANRWCELLPLPPAQKQQLMALENPLVRLELVGDVLARAGIVAG